MPDREIIIRLGVAIDTLRRQVREAQEVLAKRQADLAEAMAHLERELNHESKARTSDREQAEQLNPAPALPGQDDFALAAMVAGELAIGSSSNKGSLSDHWARRVVALHLGPPLSTTADAVRFSGVTGARTLKDNVRALFEENPMLTFTTADVVHHMRALKANHDAIRQTLKRLADDRVLMREREGVYVLNPVKPRDIRAEVRTDQ